MNGVAAVAYGFGWVAGSRADWPPVVAAAELGWDGADWFDVAAFCRTVLASGRFPSVEVDTHGAGADDDPPGIFFNARSRRVDVACGALARFDEEMRAGDVSLELSEYAELVELACELGVDPDEIGWYVMGYTQ